MTDYDDLSTGELDELITAGGISLDDYWTARIAIDAREQAESHEAAFDLPEQLPRPASTWTSAPAGPPANWVQPPPAPGGALIPPGPPGRRADPIAAAPRGRPPADWGAPGARSDGRIDLEVIAPAQDAQPTRAGAGSSRRTRRLSWLNRLSRRPR